MSDDACLALMLDAPLMSWGFSSRFQRRTTALHPTRSGIIGMICAALGVDKGSAGEAAWLARLEAVRLVVLTLPGNRTAAGIRWRSGGWTTITRPEAGMTRGPRRNGYPARLAEVLVIMRP